MPLPDAQDANILDREDINWRLVVYPVVGVLILLFGGFGIYYYIQNQQAAQEQEARAAMLQAKTPEALVKVADQYPGTSTASLALLSAADLSFDQKNFDAAGQSYHRVIDGKDVDASLRDSAQVGLASALEAAQKTDEAIHLFLTVAHEGRNSAYAPYAYMSAAQLYDQKKDIAGERRLLTELVGLGIESPFVQQAQEKLETLAPPVPAPTPGAKPAAAPATNTAAPSP